MNLLSNLPQNLPQELTTVLQNGHGVRIERIVSFVGKLVFVRAILRLGTTNMKGSNELPSVGPIRNTLLPYPPENSME